MTTSTKPAGQGLAQCQERIRAQGMPPAVGRAFARDYAQLEAGATGFILEAEIEPVARVPRAEELGEADRAAGQAALAQAVVVKLNGGLGTSMGLEQAKSLLPIKDGQSFLDFIAKQTLRHQVPLVLMNSFNTAEDTRKALAPYVAQRPDLFFDFLQHQIPKVCQQTLTPVAWPANPELEWCPPGHGDFYLALKASGLLAKLIDAGRRYLFISNSDNLGATLDLGILGYVVRQKIPFLMEVADRTPADSKGGHLAQRGQAFLLREKAQCRKEDDAAFQDIERHRYFNTNNLWINLEALAALLVEHDDVLPLPLIVNRKTVDPCDAKSTAVVQLETAMGAAIGLFAGASALGVPRSRFAPVKTTSDLLVIRSDAYEVTEDFSIRLVEECQGKVPQVDLASCYKTMAEFDARFPEVPSLRGCSRLEVKGDVTFASPVKMRGEVRLEAAAPATIAEPADLSGSYRVENGQVLKSTHKHCPPKENGSLEKDPMSRST